MCIRDRGGGDFRRTGRYWEVESETEHRRFFHEPELASWTHVTDMGRIMWGVIRADGGLPQWDSVKERAMSSL